MKTKTSCYRTALLAFIGYFGAASSGSAGVHYVDVNSAAPLAPYISWATAAKTIQEAVDAAAGGDDILVTNGVYATGGSQVSRFAEPMQRRREGGEKNQQHKMLMAHHPPQGGLIPAQEPEKRPLAGAVKPARRPIARFGSQEPRAHHRGQGETNHHRNQDCHGGGQSEFEEHPACDAGNE